MVPSYTRQVILARRPRMDAAPDDFVIDEVPLSRPASGQVVIANHYMSVDPSTRGRLDDTEKHYTQNIAVGSPLDGHAIGTVLESRDGGLPPGSVVRHRGGWREHAVMDADVVRRIEPAGVPLPTWLGLLGQTGLTGYVGMRRIAPVSPGDVVLVSAAAGAVGSAAGQFARLLGASKVIGVAGGPAKCDALTQRLGFDAAIDRRACERPLDAIAEHAPDGIDVYLDNVGGTWLVAALRALRPSGRVALCGMMSAYGDGPTQDINHLIQAVLKRLTIRGYIVRDHEDLRPEFERLACDGLASGDLAALETVREGLEQAPRALLGLLDGKNLGKMLVSLVPEPETTGAATP